MTRMGTREILTDTVSTTPVDTWTELIILTELRAVLTRALLNPTLLILMTPDMAWSRYTRSHCLSTLACLQRCDHHCQHQYLHKMQPHLKHNQKSSNINNNQFSLIPCSVLYKCVAIMLSQFLNTQYQYHVLVHPYVHPHSIVVFFYFYTSCFCDKKSQCFVSNQCIYLL